MEAGGILRDADLRERLRALDRWLVPRRGLWHPRPFCEAPPWTGDHADLADWLTGLDDGAIDAIDADHPQAPELPPAMRRWRAEARALTAVGGWPDDPETVRRLASPRLRQGVRGRKWDQVTRFAAAVLPLDGEAIVDWCGGQGHLGRTLGLLTDRPVTVLDHDHRLRARALELAGRLHARLGFVEADALEPSSLGHLRPGRSVVALHACGGLAAALVDGLEPGAVADLALAPCCFHLRHGDGDGCRPLSRAGRAASLRLDHSALRLATSDEPLASPTERARRRRESGWRLGLDLLLREGGAEGYTALGPLPREVLDLPFEAFCRRVADDRGLRLPRAWSPEPTRRAGEARATGARALALVRSLFRRPLELWLVLDRALALAERGYSVGVGTFCEPSVTPRNLLVRAVSGPDH